MSAFTEVHPEASVDALVVPAADAGIVVDSARIPLSAWQAVPLPSHDTGRAFGGVAARLGPLAPGEGADKTTPAAERLPPEPEAETEFPVMRRTRIVRRARAVREAPAAGAFLPAGLAAAMAWPATPHHEPAFAGRRTAVSDPGVGRGGYVAAVLLMVLVWAGVVGAGALFFSTPRSGIKIEWR